MLAHRTAYALAAALLLGAASPAEDPARASACIGLVRSDPARAVDYANTWRVDGGGVPARRCLGLALVEDGKPAAALTEFQAAAKAAAGTPALEPARLWGLAGNAAILAADLPAARTALTEAVKAAEAAKEPPAFTAQLLTDRAGVLMVSGDAPGAAADLDRAIALAPKDAQARLMAARLWRGQGNLQRARKEIIEAQRLAPADAEIAAEARVIANAAMNDAPARAAEPNSRGLTPY